MKKLLALLLLNLCGTLTAQEKALLRFDGLTIWVDDLSSASGFYSELLGFETAASDDCNDCFRLKTGSWDIIVKKADNQNRFVYRRDSRISLTLQVPQLLPAIDKLRKKGVKFEENELQRNKVGISIPLKDPAGNILNLMEVQVSETPAFEGFKLYNTGITSSDMKAAMEFYIEKLGFSEMTRNYLPTAMPLKHHDNSFAFMLHEKAGLSRVDHTYSIDSQMNLRFATRRWDTVKQQLKKMGISIRKGSDSDVLYFEDPFGNYCEVIKSL